VEVSSRMPALPLSVVQTTETWRDERSDMIATLIE
jgi:hypothetical protein